MKQECDGSTHNESGGSRPLTCNGQILERSSSSDDDKNGSKWLCTTFKCQRHVDWELKSYLVSAGADSCTTDDYVVIDDPFNYRRG
eukprot:CAMPEP_0172518856 /NCGR_PEP_ID=MMETSP1066-20121228/291067_1 /TAXON_ID=671091 /ORGANISM="Coscinodiscus wailesii, Strain CCMP2513" /LENGTH=85 /DNA_ID=CAMNT_0013301323 /DNA_START=715 /DNA_END=968 /DNA_ORIENTATION=-